MKTYRISQRQSGKTTEIIDKATFADVIVTFNIAECSKVSNLVRKAGKDVPVVSINMLNSWCNTHECNINTLFLDEFEYSSSYGDSISQILKMYSESKIADIVAYGTCKEAINPIIIKMIKSTDGNIADLKDYLNEDAYDIAVKTHKEKFFIFDKIEVTERTEYNI